MAPARGRSTSTPRPGTAQRAAAQEAARKAAEEEAARAAAQEANSSNRASAENLPAADPANPDDPDADDRRPLFAELTDAITGLPMLVDPSAITHISPGVGSLPHSDPAKAAKGEHEMGPVTDIGTIGGVVLRVLEDVEMVAQVLGV